MVHENLAAIPNSEVILRFDPAKPPWTAASSFPGFDVDMFT